ncbi:hypothetical protein FP507_10960 (plasmid) [Chlorobium phaeovibrioides]|uniref:Molecular chaperone GrpE n=1 Tax=Chlorobium phaeovibrioides TaxID=1094 RepID=A0A5M8I5W7_CHLPH|nr:hypothetical protein [Chlorobium phaeovibrioides]KAA6230380.1 hypothetical protein FP507_10960 [Chlorobium phaeovibrioides]
MLEQNFKQNKLHFELLDQLFEVERKLEKIQEENSITRNLNKMKNIFENLNSNSSGADGFTYHDPIGEQYNETRLDLEASIAGNSTENLIVTEVIKPIIRYKSGGSTLIARKGVVVVESKNTK